MKHSEFESKIKKSASGYYVGNFLFLLFFWSGILIGFYEKNFQIIFISSVLITLYNIYFSYILTKTYEGWKFLSYLFDDVLERISKLEKKKK